MSHIYVHKNCGEALAELQRDTPINQGEVIRQREWIVKGGFGEWKHLTPGLRLQCPRCGDLWGFGSACLELPSDPIS